MSWQQEHIPDEDRVYRRVHRKHMQFGEPVPPMVFRDVEMSVDWNRYSTPEESRDRARVPADNGIVSLGVGRVREVLPLEVSHAPLDANRAHSLVIGEKNERVRLQLSRRYRWEMRPATTV